MDNKSWTHIYFSWVITWFTTLQWRRFYMQTSDFYWTFFHILSFHTVEICCKFNWPITFCPIVFLHDERWTFKNDLTLKSCNTHTCTLSVRSSCRFSELWSAAVDYEARWWERAKEVKHVLGCVELQLVQQMFSLYWLDHFHTCCSGCRCEKASVDYVSFSSGNILETDRH